MKKFLHKPKKWLNVGLSLVLLSGLLLPQPYINTANAASDNYRVSCNDNTEIPDLPDDPDDSDDESAAINVHALDDANIQTIADALKQKDGTPVVVEGSVTTAAGVFPDSFYLQDETGGVMAFKEVPDNSLELGDKVRVYGQMNTVDNNRELDFESFDSDVVILGSGIPVDPQYMTTSQARQEQNQGMLVHVTGLVEAKYDDNSYIINDGTESILVSTDESIVDQSGPVPDLEQGDVLDAVGLAGKNTECSLIRVRDTAELNKVDNVIDVTEIQLDQNNLNLVVGESAAFKATVLPQEATFKGVTWETDDDSIAMIDDNGKVTAEGDGTATITARSLDRNIIAEATVHVTAIHVTGIELTPATLDMRVGGSLPLTATVLPEDATNKSISWESDNEAVATVDDEGIVTACSEGEAVITVTTEDGAFPATSIVKVKAPVEGVALDRSTLNLKVGDLSTLRATVTPVSATNKNVSWTSSNDSVATVDNAGKITAHSVGEAVITITTEDGGFTATCKVTVSIPVTGVGLNQSALTLKIGDTADLVAAVIPADASNKSLNWKSSNTGIASVDQDGKVTARVGGTAVITVTTQDGNKSATCTVTVTMPVEAVTLDQSLVTLKVGESANLRATITPTNATNKVLSWTSSNTAVASVDTTGKVTANAVGSAVITVTTQDGGKTATSTVAVSIPVTGVELDSSTFNLKLGESVALVANVKPDNAVNKNVSWRSSNESVATVDGSGRVTATGGGTAVITVTTQDGAKTATSTVTVNVAVTGVELVQKTLEIAVGVTATAIPMVKPDNASNKAVTWSSSRPSVATVDANGKITGVAEGTAIITVRTVDGSKIDMADVNVIEAVSEIPVTGVGVDQPTLSMKVGESATLKATVLPANATNKAVSWKSSNDSIASVDTTGKVTAKTAGTVDITVTTANGSFKATSKVTVTPTTISVTGVELDPSDLILTSGETTALTAIVRPANATNKAVSWKSSNESVAIVDQDGKVTAKSPGDTIITVTTADKGYETTAKVTVRMPVVNVTSIELKSKSLDFKIGDSAALIATVKPDNATNKAVSWQSSNESVAAIDGSGNVTAKSEGKATITVTTVDGGKSASIEVTVVRPSSGGGDGGSGGPGPTPPAAPPVGTPPAGSPPAATPPVPTPAPVDNTSKSTVTVTEDKFTNNSNGKTAVVVPANTTEVKLPSNTADLIKYNGLEIQADNLKMEIPSDLIKQLTSMVSVADLKDSTISLKMDPLSTADAQKIVEKAASDKEIKLVSDVYEFNLSITTKSGNNHVLSKFSEPITIQLKLNGGAGSNLSAIYYIADDGSLEYIGGKNTGNYMNVQISHFSKYAVLEVKKLFTDIGPGYWAETAINSLVSKQILNGTSETKFEPGRTVTRAEFTAMLARALKLTEASSTAFTDVKSGDWYADAISRAVQAGIVKGKSASLFGANEHITREEMVTMLMRGYELLNGKAAAATTISFKDESQISSWAIEFVKAAAALNLVQGRGGNTFQARGITTRAEAAQVIYNLLNR